jgi:hypothetical protein
VQDGHAGQGRQGGRDHRAGDAGSRAGAGCQGEISTTKTKITALYAAIDVSDQEPFEAMARLGLQIVQVPLP